MKVEVFIAKEKKLPAGAVEALQQELNNRLTRAFPNCQLSIKRMSNDGLSVLGGPKDAREQVSDILQETWESADDWFYH